MKHTFRNVAFLIITIILMMSCSKDKDMQLKENTELKIPVNQPTVDPAKPDKKIKMVMID